MMYQLLCDAAKTVLRGKFIAIQTYLKKGTTEISNKQFKYLKELEKKANEMKI